MPETDGLAYRGHLIFLDLGLGFAITKFDAASTAAASRDCDLFSSISVIFLHSLYIVCC